MNNYDVIIIGGGSAGLAAAIKCFDLGVNNILILERDNVLGGILNQCIHNGFGLHEFKEELSGPQYAERFIEEVNKRNIPYKTSATVIKITENRQVYVSSEEGYQCFQAGAIIVTTGCYERSAGAIRLPGDRPSGIYTAGTAQKFLNIEGILTGKNIFILGSGDIGLIMARRMTLAGAKVVGVAEIMPYSGGLNRNIVQCLNDFDIPLHLSTTVNRVIGKEKLTAIELVKVDENFENIKGSEQIIPVDNLLLSVGLIPATNLFDGLNIKYAPKTRSALVNEHCETSIPGIFVSGNGLHVHDLVDYVSEESRIAAIGAVKYLKNQLNYDDEIKVAPENGINYIVPQIVRYHNIDQSFNLKFRVKKPYVNVSIIIKVDNVIIKRVFKQSIMPSEMENIVINKEKLNQNSKLISVELEERK